MEESNVCLLTIKKGKMYSFYNQNVMSKTKTNSPHKTLQNIINTHSKIKKELKNNALDKKNSNTKIFSCLNMNLNYIPKKEVKELKELKLLKDKKGQIISGKTDIFDGISDISEISKGETNTQFMSFLNKSMITKTNKDIEKTSKIGVLEDISMVFQNKLNQSNSFSCSPTAQMKKIKEEINIKPNNYYSNDKNKIIDSNLSMNAFLNNKNNLINKQSDKLISLGDVSDIIVGDNLTNLDISNNTFFTPKNKKETGSLKLITSLLMNKTKKSEDINNTKNSDNEQEDNKINIPKENSSLFIPILKDKGSNLVALIEQKDHTNYYKNIISRNENNSPSESNATSTYFLGNNKRRNSKTVVGTPKNIFYTLTKNKNVSSFNLYLQNLMNNNFKLAIKSQKEIPSINNIRRSITSFNTVINENYKNRELLDSFNSKLNINPFFESSPLLKKRYKKERILLGSKYDDDKKKRLNLFKQLKNNPYYESAELLTKKIKICFFILGLFSLLSLIFSFIDVKLYNKYSWNLLLNKYNLSYKNFGMNFTITNLTEYYVIRNRTITPKENAIRVFIAIFNIICTILILLIYCFGNKHIKEADVIQIQKGTNPISHQINQNQNYNPYFKYQLNHKPSLKKHQNKRLHDPTDSLKNVLNFNHYSSKSNYKDSQIVPEYPLIQKKLNFKSYFFITIQCILNILFLPPSVNVAFIGMGRQVIYVYTLNSFFMIINFYKLSNIYHAIFYLSPFNSLFSKGICESHFINLDYKFLNKIIMVNSHFSYIIFNWIVLTLSISSILYGIEYLSIDLVYGNYSKKGENSFKDYFNCIYLYIFLMLRIAFGDHVSRTILGKIVLIIGSLIGSVFEAFFIYYLLRITELNDNEHKAYTRLEKLFNTENNEHKAANYIKAVLLLKKQIKENKDSVELYIKKVTNKENILQKFNFHNDPNKDKNTNFQDIIKKTKIVKINDGIDFENKDQFKIEMMYKKQFVNFLENIFVLKIKFVTEYRNFIDKYKICRNFPMSFHDALKNLENKMEENSDTLSLALNKIINVDNDFNNLITAQKNIYNLIKKSQHNGKQIQTILYSVLNDLSNKFNKKQQKKIEKQEKEKNKEENNKENEKSGLNNFFFTKAGEFKRNNTNLPNFNKKFLSLKKSGATNESEEENEDSDNDNDNDVGVRVGFLLRGNTLDSKFKKQENLNFLGVRKECTGSKYQKKK